MTNLEFINVVEAHLLAQTERCVSQDHKKSCLYWRQDGNRCAVGAVLPVELAKELAEVAPDLGLGSWCDVEESDHPVCERAVAFLSGVNPNLIYSAQDMHDAYVIMGKYFKNAVRYWAERKRTVYT